MADSPEGEQKPTDPPPTGWMTEQFDDGIAKRGYRVDSGFAAQVFRPPPDETPPFQPALRNLTLMMAAHGGGARAAMSGSATLMVTANLPELHQKMVEAAEAFVEALKSIPAGIGHNNPPESIDGPWNVEDWEQIKSATATLEAQPPTPVSAPQATIDAIDTLDRKDEKARTFFGLSSADVATIVATGAIAGFTNKALDVGLDPNTWSLIYAKFAALIQCVHLWFDALRALVK
jgi:hypothetical protein